MNIVQAAQQVMELQEAAQIHQGLLHGRQNSLQVNLDFSLCIHFRWISLYGSKNIDNYGM